MITPFCYDYQYKTESLYDSQFLGGTLNPYVVHIHVHESDHAWLVRDASIQTVTSM